MMYLTILRFITIFLITPWYCNVFSSSVNTLSKKSYGQFLITTCQGGAEKCLKADLIRNHPNFRLAFSRPGLVTFKSSEIVHPNFELNSIFSRSYSVSLGKANTLVDVINEAEKLLENPDILENIGLKPQKLRLHIWGREEIGAAAEHPLAKNAAREHVNDIYKQICELGSKSNKANDGNIWLLPLINNINVENDYPSLNMAHDNEIVFNVIIPTGPLIEEPFYMGFHIHSNKHSPWPGMI